MIAKKPADLSDGWGLPYYLVIARRLHAVDKTRHFFSQEASEDKAGFLNYCTVTVENSISRPEIATPFPSES